MRNLVIDCGLQKLNALFVSFESVAVQGCAALSANVDSSSLTVSNFKRPFRKGTKHTFPRRCTRDAVHGKQNEN
jgi:hypothetical protein